MQVNRYIRAYHKQTESLAFEVQLPPDCLTFLSMVDFLHDEIDPLLYGCTELTKEQCDYIFGHWHLLYEADTDYFDYFLECDSISNPVEIIQKQYHYRLTVTDYDIVQGICSRSDLELAKDEVRSLLLGYKEYKKVEFWCNTTIQEALDL